MPRATASASHQADGPRGWGMSGTTRGLSATARPSVWVAWGQTERSCWEQRWATSTATWRIRDEGRLKVGVLFSGKALSWWPRVSDGLCKGWGTSY